MTTAANSVACAAAGCHKPARRDNAYCDGHIAIAMRAANERKAAYDARLRTA